MKVIALLALVGVGILLLVQRLPQEPAPARPASKASAPAQAKVPALPPQAAPVRVRSEPKRVAAAKKAETVKKGSIPRPEHIPVAAVRSEPGKSADIPSQDVKAADDKPDSVFGWGPWSGGQPGATTGEAAPPQDNGIPRVQGITQTLNVSQPQSGGVPPAAGGVAVTPPPVDLSIKPGFGYGDTNHVHIHR